MENSSNTPDILEAEKRFDAESRKDLFKMVFMYVAVLFVIAVPALIHQYTPQKLEGTVVNVDGNQVVVSTENNFGYTHKTYTDVFENTTDNDYSIGDKIKVYYLDDEPVKIANN